VRLGGGSITGIATALLVALALAAPANAGTPGPTVSLGSAKGLEYVKANFPSVVSPAGAPADCDAGDVATGGGASISGPALSGTVVDYHPTTTAGEGWSATATTGEDPITETTYAICGAEDVDYSLTPASVPSTGFFEITGECASGSVVSGGLAKDNPELPILASEPIDTNSDADSTPDDGWHVTGTNNTGMSEAVTLSMGCTTAYELTYKRKVREVGAGKAKAVKAKCPKRYPVGGGGFSADFPGQLNQTMPWDSRDRKKTPEDGWSTKLFNTTPDEGEITTHAICAH
jgi:hypothetical protein